VANHKQALKRHRQSVAAHARNIHYKSMVRTFVKKALAQQATPEAPAAVEAFRKAESVVMHAASKGVIPRKRASRKVGRLARRLHQTA
jgi:small subunit ribosomal protein S20